jgi:hypothetical protein
MIVETLRPALTICCGPRPAILSEISIQPVQYNLIEYPAFNNVRVAQNIADHFQSDENIYYDGTGNNYNFNIGSKSIRTQPFSDKIAFCKSNSQM